MRRITKLMKLADNLCLHACLITLFTALAVNMHLDTLHAMSALIAAYLASAVIAYSVAFILKLRAVQRMRSAMDMAQIASKEASDE